MDIIQIGYIPVPTGVGPETFHILAETGDNLAAENNDLLRTE